MASARVDEEIERDTIEEETLLRQEDEHKGDIIKNDNFQDHDVNSSKSTKSQPKGEKEKPKGEKEKTEKIEETPAVKNKQDDKEEVNNDYGHQGDCRRG